MDMKKFELAKKYMIYRYTRALVRKQNTAHNGEIVVALIGDEATVKTFYKEDGLQ